MNSRVTAQDLGEDFERKLEDLLLNPIHYRGWLTKPYGINPGLSEGGAVGKKFMISGLDASSEERCVFPDENDQPLWAFDRSHIGHWRVMSREIIRYVPFANTPVWAMSLSGRFADSLIENEHVEETVLAVLMSAAKAAVFSAYHRKERIFFPRGLPEFVRNGFLYCCQHKGNYSQFSGSEEILHEGQIVWEATFHGSTLHSV